MTDSRDGAQGGLRPFLLSDLSRSELWDALRRERGYDTDVAATIWDGQANLRWSLEQLANETLDRAGLDIDVRAYLLAFPADDSKAEPVIEPPRGHFDRSKLTTVMRLAAKRHKREVKEVLASEEDGHVGPDGRIEIDELPTYLAALESRTRRRTLAEKLAAARRSPDWTFYVGLGVIIDDQQVFPVLGVPREAWQELPKLRDDAGDEFLTARSFQEAMITSVLDAASRELDRRSPGDSVKADPDAILRLAADLFVSSVVAQTGQQLAFGALQAFDAVSAQPYEGRAGTGSVMLVQPGHPDIDAAIQLEHPVPIGRTRAFRKVLEMSDPSTHLLCDGREVFAVGTIAGDATRTDHRFTVIIAGNGSWELWDGDTPYLRVDNGVPSMPRERLDEEEFEHTVDRVFPEISDRNGRYLWRIAQACATQAHGTMLVVHPEADAETDRLQPQGYAIRPARLAGSALAAATGIDGAVLVSPDGRCHGVGVILDGVATGTGDPSRGARYNSAIRYLAGAGKGAMVIIVSEDGKIDLLPKTKRRVRRATVQKAVDRLVAASAEGEEIEAFARADRAVERIEFYLNQEQCDLVNEAREAVEGRAWGEDRLRRQFIPIAPDPAMDDSYFVDRAQAEAAEEAAEVAARAASKADASTDATD